MMKPVLLALTSFVSSLIRSRISMQMEILALRHQLAVFQFSGSKPRINPPDRIFWSCLSRIWSGWKNVLVIVQPKTVIAWRRRKFREHWTRLCNQGKPGRPPVSKEVRNLIRQMSEANPLWGSPRIVGELRKLGIDVAKSSVEKYMVKRQKPPSPTWRSFLQNHVKDLVSIDFFTVPTIKFRVLFVFLVLAHDRRRVIHFNVTDHPSEQWTTQQLVEAFPLDEAPRYVLRDRDRTYGSFFRRRIMSMGINEVIIARQSPWQTPYVERFIGSIRRECLDHLIVLNQRHLKRILSSYFGYYHRWRTHLSLDMDCPEPRSIQKKACGNVIAFPEVGGLHHHYERLAA
jgi:transposase InsO family protein